MLQQTMEPSPAHVPTDIYLGPAVIRAVQGDRVRIAFPDQEAWALFIPRESKHPAIAMLPASLGPIPEALTWTGWV